MRALDFAFLVLGVAGLGCSAPVAASGEADADATSGTTAVVVVERTISPGEAARAEAVARFVRVRGGAVDEDALRLIGATIDFPELGTCGPIAAARAWASDNGAVQSVELVDLGAVSIEANGGRLSLQPRRLPDLVDLVSGVVYSNRAPAPEALPPDTGYVLRGLGRRDVDVAPFAVTAAAPSEPSNLFVDGLDARTTGPLTLSEGETEVSWSAGAIDDVVYVDVAQSSVAGPRNVRCLFEDLGRGVIPASSFGEGDGMLTIHRIHREAFQTRGIDAGEIRFDFARVVSFRR